MLHPAPRAFAAPASIKISPVRDPFVGTTDRNGCFAPPGGCRSVADEFQENMRGTIERCRRLAARTHDQEIARKLQALADEMEAKLSQTMDGDVEATRRNED
jgi:hypothetical protein